MRCAQVGAGLLGHERVAGPLDHARDDALLQHVVGHADHGRLGDARRARRARDSTWLAWIFSPPRTITSAIRPCSVRKPSSSTAPRSPVRSHGPRNASAVAASFAEVALHPRRPGQPHLARLARRPRRPRRRDDPLPHLFDRPADGLGARDRVGRLERVAERRELGQPVDVERPQRRPPVVQLLDPRRRHRRPAVREDADAAEGRVGARVEHHQPEDARHADQVATPAGGRARRWLADVELAAAGRRRRRRPASAPAGRGSRCCGTAAPAPASWCRAWSRAAGRRRRRSVASAPCEMTAPFGAPVVPDVKLTRPARRGRRGREPAGHGRLPPDRATGVVLQAAPRKVGSGAAQEVLAGAARQRQARRRDLQLPAQLGSAEPHVHRHDDGARLEAGEEREHPFRAVLGHQRDAVAGPHAGVGEPARQRLDRAVQLGVGVRVGAVAQRDRGAASRATRSAGRSAGWQWVRRSSNYRPLG